MIIIGADFCYSTVRYVGNLEKGNTFEERVDRIIKCVKEISDDKLLKFEWREFFDQSGDDVPETAKEIREAVLNLLKEFNECYECREVGELHFPGGGLIITGGMSWGDDPTDSFGVFYKVTMLPPEILSKGGFECDCDGYTAFITECKDKLPKKLLRDLEVWRAADKI